MKKANVAELKNRLSHYLAQVKRGETVLVMERSNPIARLIPVPPPGGKSGEEEKAWLRHMEASGILRVGPGKGVEEIWKNPPPGRIATGAVQALIEDRGQR